MPLSAARFVLTPSTAVSARHRRAFSTSRGQDGADTTTLASRLSNAEPTACPGTSALSTRTPFPHGFLGGDLHLLECPHLDLPYTLPRYVEFDCKVFQCFRIIDEMARLEYAPLAARRAAFESVKQLHATHPQWALLDHVIREEVTMRTAELSPST